MKNLFITTTILILSASLQLQADSNLKRFDGVYYLKSAEGSFNLREGKGFKVVPATDVCENQLTIEGKVQHFQYEGDLVAENTISFYGINVSPIQTYGSRIFFFYDDNRHFINNHPVSRLKYYTTQSLARVSMLKCSSPFSKYSSKQNKIAGERVSWIDGELIHKEKLSFEKLSNGNELVVKIFRKTQFNSDLPPSSYGKAVCVYRKN